jgi:outer membrane protein
MKKRFMPIFITAISLLSTASAVESIPSVGIVNFTTCTSDSKLGKQEQASFESLRKQMTSLLEDTEKQINELAAKFNDPEFLDSLSPEAEEELKNKFRSLNEDMNRYQNQYYQVLQQSNMKVMQTLNNSVNTAAEKVAKDKKLALIVNKEACFFTSSALDVTAFVITEMDKNYDQIAKQQTAPVQDKKETAQETTAKTEDVKAK